MTPEMCECVCVYELEKADGCINLLMVLRSTFKFQLSSFPVVTSTVAYIVLYYNFAFTFPVFIK